MYQVKVNDKVQYKVELEEGLKKGLINDQEFEWDVISSKSGSFHILKGNSSYVVELVQHQPEEKLLIIKVNGTNYTIRVKDKYDALLQSLGLDNLNQKKVNDLKAPMPGLVLDVRVKEGDSINKGDAILVLEAMKMENIIISAGDVKVKKIHVQKGQAVEKNQLLVSFE